MTTRSMRYATALLIAVTIGTVGACSSSEDGTANPAATGEQPTLPSSSTEPADATGVSSAPLDSQPTTSPSNDPGDGAVASADAGFLAMAYWLMGVGTEQEAVISMTVGNPAEADLTRCMIDAGFQYQQGPSPEEKVRSDLRQTMPAGDYAASYGFGIAAGELGMLPSMPADPNSGAVLSLSRAQRDAYYQTYQMCSRPAADDPFRDSNAWNAALEQFRGAVDTDERVVAANASWRGCMATAGFDYDTPNSMRESFYARLSGADRADLEQLHIDEVAAAIANVACEAALTAIRREVVSARSDELHDLFDAAVASGAAPEAQG